MALVHLWWRLAPATSEWWVKMCEYEERRDKDLCQLTGGYLTCLACCVDRVPGYVKYAFEWRVSE